MAFAHPGMMRRFGGEIAPPEVKFSFWGSMADLGRLVMRSGATQLRLRIGAALGLVFAGKLAGVIAPVMMGDAIDTLRPVAQGGIPIGATFVLFALAYAGLRLAAACARSDASSRFALTATMAIKASALEMLTVTASLVASVCVSRRSRYGPSQGSTTSRSPLPP